MKNQQNKNPKLILFSFALLILTACVQQPETPIGTIQQKPTPTKQNFIINNQIAYLDQRNKDSSIKWEIRVGIHSGPITAGVVGKRKFAYDLFGDSINIAARIESEGAAGKINISAYTHKLIKQQFSCEYRGKINAKGKGDLDMYFVG